MTTENSSNSRLRLWRFLSVLAARIDRRAGRPITDWRRRTATLLGALLLGLVAILFARAADSTQAVFRALDQRLPYAPLVLTPLLFVTTVWLTRRFAPDARGSGIPQVIAAARSPASKAAARLVSLRVAIAKALLTLLMLLGGGSVGREGPTVQVSAAIMASIHRRLGVKMTPGVMIAGGAAGVAAAFNTPLAGIAFAIEELAANYEQRLTVLVMGAVMIAGMVSLGIAGDYVYFGRVNDVLGLGDVLIYAPIAGVLGGLAGGLFSRILLAQARADHFLMKAIAAHPLATALCCGMLVAIVGVATNGAAFGTGYHSTKALLAGQEVTPWFGPAKFVVALATALSGAPGGIFAPSLAVGAGLGQLLSFAIGGGAPLVLLGMIAYFVGVVRAPFTAVIIVSEATGNHNAILSLFAAALIADWVSALVSPTRLYHGLSEVFAVKRAR